MKIDKVALRLLRSESQGAALAARIEGLPTRQTVITESERLFAKLEGIERRQDIQGDMLAKHARWIQAANERGQGPAAA
ncbi:MAG: hypothetical protein HY554_01720 [Elusimicrobia bacterium]|nr:hypothetical protein [Elusimicrobiota bacterium]